MSQKILIADKSITIQKIVELTFQEEEFEVVSVSNGKEALEKLAQIQPSIILADISLPEIDGYELCRTIRQDPRYAKYAHVPLLLLAGIYETMDEKKAKFVEDKAKEVNSNGVLTKPFDPQDLIQKVKQIALPAEKPPETKMREIEEIFQVEEPEKPAATEEGKGDSTMLLTVDERRYIMGMPAEKELSPELTEDIFEEQKAEEPFDFGAQPVKEPEPRSAPITEDIFEEAPPEPEPAKKTESVPAPIAAKHEDETVEISQYELQKAFPSPATEDIFPEDNVFDEAPLPIVETKAPVSVPVEDDILGIAEEVPKEEIKVEAPDQIIEEILPSAADVLEVKEEIAQAETAVPKTYEEPAPIKEPEIIAEESIDLKKEFEATPEDILAEEVSPADQVVQLISTAEEKYKEEKVVVRPEILVEPAKLVEPVEQVIHEEKALVTAPLAEHLFTDEIIEKIATKVAHKLSQKVLEDIAWQVIPDLAEKIIKHAAEKLPKKD